MNMGGVRMKLIFKDANVCVTLLFSPKKESDNEE